jgi:hypothetical protein
MVNKAIDALVFVLIASLTSSQLALAQATADQKATTQKTPTTETVSGTVTSTYEPGEIIVVGSDGPQQTFSLVLDKGLPYVNKVGKALNRHLIKRGTPIHLYYHNKGQTRMVYRVVRSGLSGSGLSIAGQDHCDLCAFLPGTRDYQFASHLLGPLGHRRQSETVLSITQRNEVTLSSSRNAVSFSSAHAQRNASHRRDARQQPIWFARWNPRLTEIARVHGCFSSQSFWKAGSVRNGSQIGSSLRRAGVMGAGL